MAGRVASAVLVALIAAIAFGGGTASAAQLTFTAHTFPLPNGFSSPQNFAVGDLNGDDRPDVVVVGFNGTLGIFLNDGQGGLGAFQKFQVADYTTEGRIATADFNGDGKPDAATFDAISPPSITVFYSGAASSPSCRVPNVKGKKLPAAKGAITSAHCSVGKIQKAFSAKVKRGRVISQAPSRERRAPRGPR